jgi:competence protein ComEA
MFNGTSPTENWLSTARRASALLAVVVGLHCADCPRAAAQTSASADPIPEAPAAANPAPSPNKAASPAEPTYGVVNINEASAAELERLPGIGPTRARAVLELRARLARFSRIEELLRVKGIGRATFRKLRPYLSLSGPTTLAARQ